MTDRKPAGHLPRDDEAALAALGSQLIREEVLPPGLITRLQEGVRVESRRTQSASRDAVAVFASLAFTVASMALGGLLFTPVTILALGGSAVVYAWFLDALSRLGSPGRSRMGLQRACVDDA